MTAQVSDEVLFEGAVYQLTGIDGEGLFDPTDHGLEPQPSCTACWRGHVCYYEVRDGRLLLSAVDISLKPLEGSAPPPRPLYGVAPVDGVSFFDARYEDLAAAVPFSGGLLIARDFIEALYVHMGFHPAWKYRDVRELVFEDGRLTSVKDVSAEMEAFREEMRNASLEPDSEASRAEIEAWIERTFSRSYSL